MSLRVVPVTIKSATAYVREHHRHLPRVAGGLFAVGVADGERLCGVAIVGRPQARLSQDGLTAEVVRVATDGTHNACSFLLGRARRVAQTLGYRRLLTKTLPEEGGASLRAAGAWPEGLTRGGEWSRPSRQRASARRPGPKAKWELIATQDKGEKP